MADGATACEAWQPHLAGWCVAQLVPADEDALVLHLRGCQACWLEADRLMSVAAVSLGSVPTTGGAARMSEAPPPADLVERIVGSVRRERRARRMRIMVIAASLALLVLLAGGAVLLATGSAEPPPPAGTRLALLGATVGADGEAVVVAEGAGSIVVLRASGLDAGVTYALWITPPGGECDDRVPAGTFRPDAVGVVHVQLRGALDAARVGRVWATTADGTVVLDSLTRPTPDLCTSTSGYRT